MNMIQTPQWGTTVPGTYDLGLATAFVNNAAAGQLTPSQTPDTLAADLASISQFVTDVKVPEAPDARQAFQNAMARFSLSEDTPPWNPSIRERVSQALAQETAMIRFQGISYADKLGLLGGLEFAKIKESGIATPDSLHYLAATAKDAAYFERINLDIVDFRVTRNLALLALVSVPYGTGWGISATTIGFVLSGFIDIFSVRFGGGPLILPDSSGMDLALIFKILSGEVFAGILTLGAFHIANGIREAGTNRQLLTKADAELPPQDKSDIAKLKRFYEIMNDPQKIEAYEKVLKNSEKSLKVQLGGLK